MSEQTPDVNEPDISTAQPERRPTSPINAAADDFQLVEALRRNEEAAFAKLLQLHHTALVRLASIYVSNRATAEEVAQETWLAVLQGIHRFEGRSSLKTWIFRILVNQAKKRGQREGRQLPFSAMWRLEDEPDEPAVAPDRFIPADAPQWANHWTEHPQDWDDIPESRLLSQETQACLLQAIEMLPPSQREVITLRDINGWTADEVCTGLGISGVNQRVLLHRARSKVRHVLEQYFNQ